MQTEDESLKPNPAWKVALVGLPLFLAVSGVVAVMLLVNKDKDEGPDPRLALPASGVTSEEVEDQLFKVRKLIGERSWHTPGGRQAMRRMIAFLEGTLSPHNYGFAVQKGHAITVEDETWPTLWVDLAGTERPAEIVLVVAEYDGPAEEVVAVLAALNDLRDERMENTVRFAFLPNAGMLRREGKERTMLIRQGRSVVETLVEIVGPEPRPGVEPASTGEVMAAARELAGKVRELALPTGKMP